MEWLDWDCRSAGGHWDEFRAVAGGGVTKIAAWLAAAAPLDAARCPLGALAACYATRAKLDLTPS